MGDEGAATSGRVGNVTGRTGARGGGRPRGGGGRGDAIQGFLCTRAPAQSNNDEINFHTIFAYFYICDVQTRWGAGPIKLPNVKSAKEEPAGTPKRISHGLQVQYT